MVSPVSSSQAPEPHSTHSAPPPPKQEKESVPEDTVHLSSTAKSGSKGHGSGGH